MNSAPLKNVNSAFWILTCAVFTILIVPGLIQDGMFMDGQIYAGVAKNLANGIGTFWDPHFSQTAMSSYHEQPPLFFAIQALFFKVLGSSIYTERICSFVMACLTAWLINLTWKELFKQNNTLKLSGWLPVFLWITVPVCFWAYINNVEETMMAVFDILSVYLILKGIHTQNKFIYFLIAGVSIFSASLCKGFQGLFPVTAIGCYWLATRNISFQKTWLYSLILAGVPAVIYSLLLLDEQVFSSYKSYFQNRLTSTFNNNGPTTDFRFYLLGRILTELIPAFIICIILLIIAKIKRVNPQEYKPDYRSSLFFILIAISGTFPLMVTLEQRGFYLVTALPYFAIGIAILAAPLVNYFTVKLNNNPRQLQLFKYASITLLLVCTLISFSMSGKTKRDTEMLHDVYLLGKLIPKRSVIQVDPPLWTAWNLQAYFVRHFNISLDPINKHDYFLIEKEKDVTVRSGYKKIELQSLKYNLYKTI